jgi:hypothetical protein
MHGVPTFYVDEFRTSKYCNRCLQPCTIRRRTVRCPTPSCGGARPPEVYDKSHQLQAESGMDVDRDHNAGSNMAKASQQWLTTFKWPEPLDRELLRKKHHSKNASMAVV